MAHLISTSSDLQARLWMDGLLDEADKNGIKYSMIPSRIGQILKEKPITQNPVWEEDISFSEETPIEILEQEVARRIHTGGLDYMMSDPMVARLLESMAHGSGHAIDTRDMGNNEYGHTELNHTRTALAALLLADLESMKMGGGISKERPLLVPVEKIIRDTSPIDTVCAENVGASIEQKIIHAAPEFDFYDRLDGIYEMPSWGIAELVLLWTEEGELRGKRAFKFFRIIRVGDVLENGMGEWWGIYTVHAVTMSGGEIIQRFQIRLPIIPKKPFTFYNLSGASVGQIYLVARVSVNIPPVDGDASIQEGKELKPWGRFIDKMKQIGLKTLKSFIYHE